MNTSSLTRRRFLGQSSLTLAGLAVAPRLGATVAALPTRSTRAVATFLRPAFEPETLRTLATGAIDAALHAGAEWADIRLGDRRVFRPGAGNLSGELSVTCGFGLRVRINGVEAFVGGIDPVPERLRDAAQSAVATARELANAVSAETQLFPLAPVPVVTGEWRAPIEIDPFALSVDDHAALLGGGGGAHDGVLSRWRRRGVGIAPGQWWEWVGETRVFASSDGSLLTQCLGGVDANVLVGKSDWRLQRDDVLALGVDGQHAQTGGVELVLRPTWFADIEAAMEELARYATLPGGVLDVGRYAVVLDGPVHAQLLGQTLLPALSFNRVLGNELDLSGASFLAPPDVHVGDQVCSPLLSYRVDGLPDEHVPGHRPNMYREGMPLEGVPFGARRWDDDGVPTTTVPLIERGTLVNYLASRATHSALATIAPISSTSGTVSAPLGGIAHAELASRPAERPPSVSAEPASSAMSLDDLARHLGHGVLVRGGTVDVDPTGMGGYIYKQMLLEVRGGRIVRRIRGARLQFSTKRVLRNLVTVGDARTSGTVLQRSIVPGVPWAFPQQAWTAPAAQYRDVDLVLLPGFGPFSFGA